MPHQGSLLANSKHLVPVAVAELEEDHMDECEACGGHLERVLICPRCRRVAERLRYQPTRNNALRSTCVEGGQLLVTLGLIYFLSRAVTRFAFLAMKKERR
jgi:hypothetical protein